ncbi:hypothetical protein [Amycolatopsis sp. DSM 110486]|uniref:hypothetical protein n=1 Tax=Amycolatopsis sp. DSM 110486 TaxID=2865832 RepID=UPI001C6A628E|nr:hypothetical protein [Amycolatopsis sp. DSM 110486]QYN17544.1 hypothetical protein K1T34_32685 [Amycolatopsis sp. DSM 110486]
MSDQTPRIVVPSEELDEARADVEKFRDYLGMAQRLVERRGRERDAARAELDALKRQIREVLATKREGSIDDANFFIVESVRAIVGRETPREEPNPCDCAKGYAVCDSCRAKHYPRGMIETSAPRTLLGWTVPEHIEFEINGNRSWALCITCNVHFRDDIDYPNAMHAAGAFLTRHRHGRVVEHQPGSES